MSIAQKMVVGKFNGKNYPGWEDSRNAGLEWIHPYGVNWIHLAPEKTSSLWRIG